MITEEITLFNYRSTDPATSRLAAAEVVTNGTATRQRNMCLEQVLKQGGMTAAEIAKAVGLERHAPSRRLPELRSMGLVINGPSRVCTVTGRPSITWIAVEKQGGNE